MWDAAEGLGRGLAGGWLCCGPFDAFGTVAVMIIPPPDDPGQGDPRQCHEGSGK